MKKIVIIGGSGMLGGMLTEFFSGQTDCKVIATVRDNTYLTRAADAIPNVEWVISGADHKKYTIDFDSIPDCDWIINAIGIIKPLIKDDNPDEVQRAIWVNSVLPHRIGELAQKKGAKVLQIATDCVYSGQKGSYVETDPHDALDVYGKTKSLGECYLSNVNHLRCSIIGPEVKDRRSLLEWFLGQPRGATVKGFSNHQWNGITTLHFAKVCHGIINRDIDLPHLQHIIPGDMLAKADMLKSFAKYYNRQDMKIEVVEAASKIDRTLQTNNIDLNKAVWKAAGYVEPPAVQDMIKELSLFKVRMISG